MDFFKNSYAVSADDATNIAASIDTEGDGASVKASTTTIMPGGLLAIEKSSGSYTLAASVNFGYVYDGNPYIVGAGHASDPDYVGKNAYYIPYSGAGYPIAGIATTYNSANRVKIGVVAMSPDAGGNYDFFTIRVTESNLKFTHTGYNGWKINAMGGTVSEGAALRVCGVTTRYDASYEYGFCTSANFSYSAHGSTMTNLIVADFGANNGTSGGPLITPDSNGNIRLVGLASVNNIGAFASVHVKYMIDSFSLSPLAEGTISV